jgi:hypothetical protein
MKQHVMATTLQWTPAGLVWLALLSASWAADPLVPVTVRPLELLRQEEKAPGARLGMFDVHLNLRAGLLHDDNIQLTSTNQQADFITSVSAEIMVIADRQVAEEGLVLSLVYRPTLNVFAKYTSNTALDHYAKASGLWASPKLTLGLSQEFRQVSAAMIEVGRRLQQEYYITDVTAKYALSEKTSIELNPRLTVFTGEDTIGTQEWAADAFFNWQATPKLLLAAGGSLGYLAIDDNASELFERALLRAKYTATVKLDVTATVGVEFRQFDSGRASVISPVLGLSGTYRPWDRTILTLEAHRREQPATTLSDQSFASMGFSAEIYQQIMNPYFISALVGFEHRGYRSTEPGVAVTRRDDSVRARATVGAHFLRHWTVMVFYQYQRNQSNQSANSNTDNQVGCEASWGF